MTVGVRLYFKPSGLRCEMTVTPLEWVLGRDNHFQVLIVWIFVVFLICINIPFTFCLIAVKTEVGIRKINSWIPCLILFWIVRFCCVSDMHKYSIYFLFDCCETEVRIRKINFWISCLTLFWFVIKIKPHPNSQVIVTVNTPFCFIQYLRMKL